MVRLVISTAAVAMFCSVCFATAQTQTFRVGEKVLVEASGHWIPCTVAEAGTPNTTMRVDCEAYPKLSRAAGRYIVHDTSAAGIRRPGDNPPGPSAKAQSPSTATAAAEGRSLRVGEYACYGSGSQIMAGLGFKVLPGGRYTDLDGKNPGTYSISGTNITFHGGHMESVKGWELKGHNFRVGAQAVCSPF